MSTGDIIRIIEQKHENGVRELVDPDLIAETPGATTCGTCGRTWDDDVVSDITPAPSGRCPFEYDHWR